MTERPILMSAPMVRATLDDSKTQTRRIVKPQPREASPGPGIRAALFRPGDFVWPDKVPGCSTISCKPHGPDGWAEENSPYGKPGDRLWVREDWAPHPQDTSTVFYRATVEAEPGFPVWSGPWRPSIQMPRWASRITLEITGVRVERLQDISDTDAVAEGIGLNPSAVGVSMTFPQGESACRAAFRVLWKSIKGPESWATNPWVWVIEFRRIAP